jgi:hypothetical protein
MALIKCKECGLEVSNKAKNCPKCGAPIPKTSIALLMVAAIFVIGYVFYMKPNSTPTKPPDSSTPTKVSRIDKSEETQKKRKELIQNFTKTGVIQKVEKLGSLPQTWVNPVFYTLDYDDKKSIIEVVYGYYFDDIEADNFVIIVDGLSGNEAGDYSYSRGLKMK